MAAWEKVVVLSNATIEKVINILNETGFRIVLVVSIDGTLEGTISDGDVRRGLLRGLSLSDSAKDILFRNPLVVGPYTEPNKVLELMNSNGLFQVPIISDNGKVIGLHLWENLKESRKRPNLMVIMAGGKGTRLLPRTENIPKPMLRIMGKPILQHIVEQAKYDGVSNFAIAVHHLSGLIEEYFQDGSKFGVNIEYLREAKPLGTAGALGLLSQVPKHPIIVSNGDIVTDVSYGNMLDYHSQNNAFATMAVQFQEIQNPFGIVEVEGNEIRGFREKPITKNLINAGVYVLDPSSTLLLEESMSCDMPFLFQKLMSANKKVVAFPLHENWIDIGRPEDLDRALKLE
jgi:dTDP-glucose pyrophosphorylase